MTKHELLASTSLSTEQVEIEGTVDPHFHFREEEEVGDGRMEMLMKEVIDEHECFVAIGNISKPILTLADAKAYQKRLLKKVPRGKTVDIRIAPLVTDMTTPEMIYEMRTDPKRTVVFVKVFFFGVSNDGGASVRDIDNLRRVLRAASDESIDAPPLAVHFHAESKYFLDGTLINDGGRVVNFLDREWYCVDKILRNLFYEYPKGEYAIKHVTDLRTLGFIDEQRTLGRNVYGEICPSYLKDALEDLFEGPGNKGTAFQAFKVRWPFPKPQESKAALKEALLSGRDYYFYGSDCACHVDDPTKAGGVKITVDGFVCGGATILPAVDKSIVIDLLVRNGRPDLINEFMSRRVRRHLRLPASKRRHVYVRNEWKVPEYLFGSKDGTDFRSRLYMGGETCNWVRA